MVHHSEMACIKWHVSWHSVTDLLDMNLPLTLILTVTVTLTQILTLALALAHQAVDALLSPRAWERGRVRVDHL